MRYAVYFAPEPDHPLWVAGSAWLGRDARPGKSLGGPPAPWARSPWHYGFHATLKAPMTLLPDKDPAAFIADVTALAQRHPPFVMPALEVQALGAFLALRPLIPVPQDHPLQILGNDCVQALDGWRAPLSAADRVRRERQGLDDEQRTLLERWGYPHVLHRWRFHLTLSDALAPDQREGVQDRAVGHFEQALATPLFCNEIAIFVEPAPRRPLVWVHRCPLAGRV